MYVEHCKAPLCLTRRVKICVSIGEDRARVVAVPRSASQEEHARRHYGLASLSSHVPTTVDQNSGCARNPSDA